MYPLSLKGGSEMIGDDFVSLVNNLGFPIACVVACAIFIAYIYVQNTKDSKEREETIRQEYLDREQRLYEQNERINETLGRATETIDRMNIRLDVIEDKIDDLKLEVRSK